MNRKGRAKDRTVKELKRLQRRQRVATLYLEGMPQHEIALKLNVSPLTIHKDLTKIRDYWLTLMATDFNSKKSQELAKLDLVEAEAMKGWRRSCRPAQSRHTSVKKGIRIIQPKDKNGVPIKGKAPTTKMVPIEHLDETTEKGQAGDPRFLQIIKECIECRMKVMGLLDDKATTNVYVDFSGLLKERQEKKELSTDNVIENIIAQVGHENNTPKSGDPGENHEGN